jgi:prolactin regulatory element-binding protein
MAGGDDAPAARGGKVACAAWIRRRDEKAAAALVFVAQARAGAAGSPPAVEVLGFDSKECYLSPDPLVRERPPINSFLGFAWLGILVVVDLGVSVALQARAVLGEGGAGDAPRGIAVHPAGDELVCATAKGCRFVSFCSSVGAGVCRW